MLEFVLEDELEGEIQRSDEYLERVYGILRKMKRALGTVTTPPPPETEPAGEGTETTPHPVPADHRATTTPRDETPTPTVAHTSDRVKLPKISLPHFRGNSVRWTAFWDSFNSAIHSNDRLSEIDKFNYLRSLLEGTAYDAISGLSLSAANYAAAVEILKKRFGNKQQIISKHMESLLSFSVVTSDHHLRDLCRLYDQCESNIWSLRALGVEPETYGAMLSSVLLSKLPQDFRLIVSRRISTDDLHMESLLEIFEEELLARERANNSVGQQPPTRRAQNQGRSPTSAFVATAQGSPSCAFCNQSHYSTECSTVTDVESHKKSLRESGRCFNCL